MKTINDTQILIREIFYGLEDSNVTMHAIHIWGNHSAQKWKSKSLLSCSAALSSCHHFITYFGHCSTTDSDCQPLCRDIAFVHGSYMIALSIILWWYYNAIIIVEIIYIILLITEAVSSRPRAESMRATSCDLLSDLFTLESV